MLTNPVDLIVFSERMYHREEGLCVGTLYIKDGKILAQEKGKPDKVSCPLINAGTHIVMPALVDTHVHVNEPGRTEWEGYQTATQAAAAGGVGCIVDMPLNSSPPTTTLYGLEKKISQLKDNIWVDVGLFGGIIPLNTSEITSMLDKGVLGFKCFLINSGIDEFPYVEKSDIEDALDILSATKTPLLAHAELSPMIEKASHRLSQKKIDVSYYKYFLESRPKVSEDDAVLMMLELCRTWNSPVHIVHYSSANSLLSIKNARDKGLPISIETCPHYLHFSAEEIKKGATEFKCVPPIREKENQDKLWDALLEGSIDQVVSDHSPCLPSLKLLDRGDFMKAWGGISSLQLGLPIMWSEISKRSLGIDSLVKWMCEAPAKLAGISNRKGNFKKGLDADIVIWDPDSEIKVQGDTLYHKHPITPYEGKEFYGLVLQTLVRGKTVYKEGQFSSKSFGKWIKGRE